MDKIRVPGASLILSGTTLHVRQTPRNLEQIRQKLSTTSDAPNVRVNVPGMGSYQDTFIKPDLRVVRRLIGRLAGD